MLVPGVSNKVATGNKAGQAGTKNLASECHISLGRVWVFESETGESYY